MIVTTWRHVRPGAMVHIKGLAWRVTSLDPITLEHPAHGRRTGSPAPDSPVSVAEPREDSSMTIERACALVIEQLGGVIVG